MDPRVILAISVLTSLGFALTNQHITIFRYMANTHIFSSESVTEGHPDKVCDSISDAVLDACFEQDTSSRVACETMVKDNAVILGGEITTSSEFDYRSVVKKTLEDMNYDSSYADGTDYSYTCKFDAQNFFFMNLLGLSLIHI